MADADPSDLPTRTAVLEHRADTTDRALETLRRDMNQGFADLRREMNLRFDEMSQRFDQRLDQRFDGLTARMDQLSARMDQHLRWVITTMITTAFAIIGTNVGILTLLLRGR